MSASDIKPAATILLLRDDPGLEVLMVKRHHQIDFASGALVFPGGKSHAGDHDPAWAEHAIGWERFDAEQRGLRTAAIREAASARIDEQIAVVQGKVAAVKAAARRAVARAEKKLASEIERALRESIPSELSGSKSWVDPFIGARAYYYFTDSLYSVAKADIGGFGISSDLTWQAYAALGYKLSKRASVELGYKYMAVDYTSGDFTNDVRTSGVFLSLGLKL